MNIRQILLGLPLVVCLWMPSADAQSVAHLVGNARAAALGHATTALPDDVGSQANPAAAAAQTHRTVHLFAREAYGLAELHLGTADVVYPLSPGTAFGGAGTFGFEDYRESFLHLGWAQGFSLGTARLLRAGLDLRYHHTSIATYGQAGALGLNAGVQARPLPTLTFGAHATNLNAPQLIDGEDLPRSLAVGLSYAAAPPLTVLIDAVKDIDFPLSVRGGMEAYPVAVLALRAGFTTRPTRFTAGAGIRLGPLAADLAAEQHQDLGWSPAVGLVLRW